MSWTEHVPNAGHLTLYYTSDRDMDCDPVWSCRQRMCSQVLCPPCPGSVIEDLGKLLLPDSAMEEKEEEAEAYKKEAAEKEEEAVRAAAEAINKGSGAGDSDSSGDDDDSDMSDGDSLGSASFSSLSDTSDEWM